MASKNVQERESLLHDTLSLAITLLLTLDESSDSGRYPAVPSVIIWVMENRHRRLMQKIKDGCLLDDFRDSIIEYYSLRDFSFQLHPLNPHGATQPTERLLIKELRDALDLPATPVSDVFRLAFLSATFERLKFIAMGDIDFGGGVLAFNPEDFAPVFEHDIAGCIADTRSPSPFALGSALSNPMVEILNELKNRDDGFDERFWEGVDVDAELAWQKHRYPRLTDSETYQLRAELTRYVEAQIRLEPAWQALGPIMHTLLALHADDCVAKKIIDTVLSAQGFDTRSTISVESVYSMFCRRLPLFFD